MKTYKNDKWVTLHRPTHNKNALVRRAHVITTIANIHHRLSTVYHTLYCLILLTYWYNHFMVTYYNVVRRYFCHFVVILDLCDLQECRCHVQPTRAFECDLKYCLDIFNAPACQPWKHLHATPKYFIFKYWSNTSRYCLIPILLKVYIYKWSKIFDICSQISIKFPDSHFKSDKCWTCWR